MSSLYPGCSAFPVGHASYFAALDTLEIGGAARLVRPQTAAGWRAQAPRDFVFSVVCDREVTLGCFRETREAQAGWERTRAVADALGARFIVFETPGIFYAQADHLRAFYRFIRAMPGGTVPVWQPSRGWDPAVVGRICKDLRLVHAVDPLAQDPRGGAVQYFRLRGGGPGRKPSRGHRYSDTELCSVAEMAKGKLTYAYFQTANMWDEARKLRQMTATMPAARYLRPPTETGDPPRYLPPRGGGE